MVESLGGVETFKNILLPEPEFHHSASGTFKTDAFPARRSHGVFSTLHAQTVKHYSPHSRPAFAAVSPVLLFPSLGTCVYME